MTLRNGKDVCFSTCFWKPCKYSCMHSNTDTLCPAVQCPWESREEIFMRLGTTSQDRIWTAVNQNERALPDLAWALQLQLACSAPHFSALQVFHGLASKTKRLGLGGPGWVITCLSWQMSSNGRAQPKGSATASRVFFTQSSSGQAIPGCLCKKLFSHFWTTLPHNISFWAGPAWQFTHLHKRLSESVNSRHFQEFLKHWFPFQRMNYKSPETAKYITGSWDEIS